MIDGSQQCSVLQAISGDIDGIIHSYSCCAGFECWFFSFFSRYVGCQSDEVFTKSGVLYTYYFIHIFTETKKILC